MDKRIHFALVCGAKSCPPIRVYTPDELDEGLDAAAAAFCEGATCMLMFMPSQGSTDKYLPSQRLAACLLRSSDIWYCGRRRGERGP
jgi:Protein of unknown function, DUF547